MTGWPPAKAVATTWPGRAACSFMPCKAPVVRCADAWPGNWTDKSLPMLAPSKPAPSTSASWLMRHGPLPAPGRPSATTVAPRRTAARSSASACSSSFSAPPCSHSMLYSLLRCAAFQSARVLTVCKECACPASALAAMRAACSSQALCCAGAACGQETSISTRACAIRVCSRLAAPALPSTTKPSKALLLDICGSAVRAPALIGQAIWRSLPSAAASAFTCRVSVALWPAGRLPSAHAHTGPGWRHGFARPGHPAL